MKTFQSTLSVRNRRSNYVSRCTPHINPPSRCDTNAELLTFKLFFYFCTAIVPRLWAGATSCLRQFWRLLPTQSDQIFFQHISGRSVGSTLKAPFSRLLTTNQQLIVVSFCSRWAASARAAIDARCTSVTARSAPRTTFDCSWKTLLYLPGNTTTT